MIVLFLLVIFSVNCLACPLSLGSVKVCSDVPYYKDAPDMDGICHGYWEMIRTKNTYCWHCEVCAPYASNCVKGTPGCRQCKTVMLI